MRLIALSLVLIGFCACGGLQSNHSEVTSQAVANRTTTVEIPEGRGSFLFSQWSGPEIKVWAHRPSDATPETPIVIVMHGSRRDGRRYRDQWSSLADEHDLIIIAPEFSDHAFPNANGYNLGYVFDRTSGEMRDEHLWAFSAIEPLFDDVVSALDGAQTGYSLYGHSAGAQFVHRFLYYKPNARVKRAFPANAGWYTIPSDVERFPYGLRSSGVDDDVLRSVFEHEVIVLLGERDTKTSGKNLRRTEEAMRQGHHRLARGKSFFATAKSEAVGLGAPFKWQLVVVNGVGHKNSGMARVAASMIE